LQLACQLADGRRACAGAQLALFDALAQLLDDLRGQRLLALKAANGTVMLKSPIQYRCNSGQLYCQLYGFVAMMCAELAQSDFYPPADLETLP